MAVSVTFNGTAHSIPSNRQAKGWGASLSSFLVDVGNNALSKAGGSFVLTADANFGSNCGLVAKYLKSASSNIASSGVIRLARADEIVFRNQANNADLALAVNSSNVLTFNGVNILQTSASHTILTDIGSNSHAQIDSHIASGSNPHSVTATQVGLGNVDNTSDATKNSATATLQNKTLTAPDVTGGSYINMLTQAAVRFNDDSGGEYVALQAPTGVTTHTLKLPAAQGAASTSLTNDGSGNLSWAAAASATLNQYHTDIGNSSNVRTATNTNLLGDAVAKTNTATITMTIAAPGVVSWTSHGLSTYDKVYFTTSGALPTGVTASTTYYITLTDANSFRLSTTLANAVAGTFITTTGSQSGTHTGFSGGLAIPDVSSTTRGLVNSTTQTIPGLKTFSTGVALPTSGGTASTLDYYEEHSFNLIFDSGMETGANTAAATIRRIGKFVSMEVAQLITTAGVTTADWATNSAEIPSRFRPSADVVLSVRTVNNNTTDSTSGILAITSAGNVEVRRSASWTSTTTNCGFRRFSATWHV